MTGSDELDPLAVRRQFSRRAPHLQDADFLLRAVEAQMLERLEFIKLLPQTVLDVGCGLGDGLLALRRRYPQAQAIGLDVAEAVAHRAANRLALPKASLLARMLGQLRRTEPEPLASVVCADTQALPLAFNSVDLIWSNLCLHWLNDPVIAISEWQRVIRPNGLVMFTMFGVDTLRELRGAGSALMTFRDMHDIGDALVSAGFADPVMDMSPMTLSFEEPQSLWSDLNALGGNALRGRQSGLNALSARARWVADLLRMRDNNDRLQVSVEVCHGHAWCPPEKKRADGLSRIQFRPK